MEAVCNIEQRDGESVAVLRGDWTANGLRGAERELKQAVERRADLKLDMQRVRRCDTAGAYAIIEATQGKPAADHIEVRPETARLLDLVRKVLEAESKQEPVRRPTRDLVERLGRGVIGVGADFWQTMAFNGHLFMAMGRTIINPRRLRTAPLFSLAERTGIDALPIVAVTAFFIGAVIAFIGANMLSDFGAQVFTVELIGIAVLREFGVVITAVLLAGRSASSFAAEIGAMKMNDEIDAMEVMGVDPFEALVLPRFLALLLTIPLLTFVAMLCGLAGGMIVCWSALDLSPSFFVKRIAANVGVIHFWVGIWKAPVFATVIAAIGCRQGMEVGGDVESLGRRVTAAVVHAIFSIILLDAVFALIYMEINV